MKAKPLFKLTATDRAIFDEAAFHPNVFLDWYMRGPNTGTWAAPDADDSRLVALYRKLATIWLTEDMPKSFAYESYTVNAVARPGYEKPHFHVQHGWMFQPWQEDWHLAKQKVRVVAGGFGSGKTIASIMSMMLFAATLPGFIGFGIAPYTLQSREIFDKALKAIQGTRFEKQFLLKVNNSPYPQMIIGNDLVGDNKITFFSALDDPEKLLNLEGDMAMIDQTEQLTDIPATRKAVSSRLRGFHQGRERLSVINFIGNPYDNPEFWDLYDEGEENPQQVYSLRVSTYDNAALSEAQVRAFESNIGDSEQARNVYLRGYRPVGDGKQFPASSVTKCISPTLDEELKNNKDNVGYIIKNAPRVGLYHYEMPIIPHHQYVVIADPGHGSPPYRNSAVIGVWDVTDFPNTPAHLRAFSWVYGNGSPDPWMQQFYDFVIKYQAVGRCAFDSTGPQTGYDRWVDIFKKVNATGLSLTASSKFLYLNAAKIMMAKGMIQFPSIQGMLSQLARYDIPDDKLNQDIVMMLAMACGWLEQLYYLQASRDWQTTKNFGMVVNSRGGWRGEQRAHRR